MKDWFLIPMLWAVFAFGFYISTRVDHFIEENQRRIAAENRYGRCTVRIAAENPMLFSSIASALEHCSRAEPSIGFSLSSGRAKGLMEKLDQGQVDMLLLAEKHAGPLDRQFTSFRIPYQKTKLLPSCLGLPVEYLDEEPGLYVIWKRNRTSNILDTVIFALEIESERQNCCYADYLD